MGPNMGVRCAMPGFLSTIVPEGQRRSGRSCGWTCRGLSVLLSLATLSRCAGAVPGVEGGRCRLSFGPSEEGHARSLVDAASSIEVLAGRRGALLRLALSKRGDTSGELTWLSDEQAATSECIGTASGAGVRLRFDRLAGLDIGAEVSVMRCRDSGDLLWRVRIGGDASYVLEEVEFPVLQLGAPPREGETSAFVFGLSKGGVFHNPGKWPVGKRVNATQPGVLAAQFGCYYGEAAGVLTVTRDPEGHPKTLEMQRNREGLELLWRHHRFHSLEAPFELEYPVAVTTFGSGDESRAVDWRDAADLYRAWAAKQPWCTRTLAARKDVPDWLKQGPAVVRFSREWLGQPERVEAWLQRYWLKHFPDVPVIVALWGWEGIATWVSPEYFPAHPSEDGLRQYVGAIRRAGGHSFFWPSGYQWALTYGKREDGTFEHDGQEFYERLGREHTIQQRDGSPFIREYRWLRGGRNATLCRGDPWTRRWLNEIALELTKRGADLVQVDQVVSAGTPGRGRCYSTEHGHPPGPGSWDTVAFGEQLRGMGEECRRLNPDLVLGFEEPQELFTQHVAIQDYRDSQIAWQPRAPGHVPASVYGYLYHDYTPCFQSNPRRNDLTSMIYCAVNGQVPHLIPHWPVTPAPLLRNGEFEEWDDDVPAGWQRVERYKDREYAGRSFADREVRRGGASSLRLESPEEDDIAQVSQNVLVGASGLAIGRAYRLSLWYRAPSLTRDNAVVFGAFDSSWQSKGTWRIPLTASDVWRQGTAEFTVPEGAVLVRFMLHLLGPATVWLDDVALEEQSAEGEWQVLCGTGLPPEHEAFKRWVELFHGEGRPYLLLGRMLTPPRLVTEEATAPSGPFPSVFRNAFRAPDGREAVVLGNGTARVQRGRLSWKGKAMDVRLSPWELRLVE